MSLTALPLLAGMTGLAALLLLAATDLRTRAGRARAGGALVATVLIVALLAWGQARYGWFPAGFPISYYGWAAVPVLAGCTLFSVASPLRVRRVIAAALAIPVGLAAGALAINRDYDLLPDVVQSDQHTTLQSQPVPPTGPGARPVRSARPGPPPPQRGTRERAAGHASQAGSSAGMPNSGTAFEVTIPAPISHFAARPAWIWVPPAYLADPAITVPVVMLLAGNPGMTSDWLRAGRAGQTASRYAASHHGIAPILVMPDDNGGFDNDTECLDSPRGNAETYLTSDVPNFVHQQLGASLHRWAVAGLSESGTCAAMLALRHPALFAVFADYSGLTSPTPSNWVNPDLAARTFFGGSLTRYHEHDPLWLLAHSPARTVAGIWVAGSADHGAVRAQRELIALAAAHGLRTWSQEVPGGGHSFALWSRAFSLSLPVLVNDEDRSSAA